MNATAINGDVWQGDRDGEYWIYADAAGNLYESKEVPVFRVDLRELSPVIVNGKVTCLTTPPTHTP